jgi:hypothetical protein
LRSYKREDWQAQSSCSRPVPEILLDCRRGLASVPEDG